MTSDIEQKSASEINISAEEEDSRKKYKCEFEGCKSAFFRPSRLKNHLNVHSNKKLYKCSYTDCDKSYFNPSHLKRHVQIHSTVKQTYECNICHNKISTLSNLKRHYNRAHCHDNKLFCKGCNLKFRKKNRYEEHMASHENKLLYQCDKCERQFLTKLKLTRHEECHKDKQYKCTVENCPEVFEKWAYMQKHKKIEHRFIEYHCTKCSKVFTSKCNYKKHMQIHSENRPLIPCSYNGCNRLYYFKRNLNLHIRIYHKGNKFHCNICDAKLSSKKNIRHHIITLHLTEKKKTKRKEPLPRKDKGIARKSLLSELSGVKLNHHVEKKLLQRKPIALLRDNEVENNSFSEDDRGSDVSAKGA